MSNRFNPYERHHYKRQTEEDTVTIPLSTFKRLMSLSELLGEKIPSSYGGRNSHNGNEGYPMNSHDYQQQKNLFYKNAQNFFHTEIKMAETKHFCDSGYSTKIVTFQSDVVFGRINMEGSTVLKQSLHECLRDMSKLWQSGGHVIIESPTRYKEDETCKSVYKVVVFKITTNRQPIKLTKGQIDEFMSQNSYWANEKNSKAYIM